MRFTYHDTRTYHTPSIQALQAIDLSTEVRYAPVIDKHNGDIVFTANAVVEHFDEFQDVKRYTQDDWETLPLHLVQIHTFDNIETIQAFPAFPEEILYVAKRGAIPQQPDLTHIEVFDEDGMESFPDPSGQADFSDYSLYDSDPYNSNYNAMYSMAGRWTLNEMNKEIRLQLSFFALPKGLLPSGDIDPSAFQLKMFSLCNNRRTEHESTSHCAHIPGVDVKRPYEFLKRFSASLLWGLQMLKDNLRDLDASLGGGRAEYIRITTLLLSELDLANTSDVESLVDKMISHLQGMQPQDGMEQTRDDQGIKDQPPLSRHDIAVLQSYLAPRPDILQHDAVYQGLVHAYDSKGHEQLMCPNCFHLLYPSHSAEYVTDHIGALGEYDIQRHCIVLRPQDSEGLQRLCLLDTAKVGRVTKFVVDVNWDATTEDLQSIHTLASKLELTSLTIATTAVARSNSSPCPSPPLSPSSEEPLESQLETIKRLSHALFGGLTHLCIDSHVVLNAPAVLFDLRRLPPRKHTVVVTVKEPFSRCIAGLFNGNIQLLDLRTSLAHASRISTTRYFASNLQSITITDRDSLLTEEDLLSKTNAVMTILRSNPDLSSFTISCDARDFQQMETMMESIYSKMTSEQAAPHSRLSTYTLVDNSYDHLFVTFKLPNSRDTKAIVANAAIRKNGPDLGTFLDRYGPFIQTLNTNDKLETSAVRTLQKSFIREGFSLLQFITIFLGDLQPEAAMRLSSILQWSKATLQQLVLVGAPEALQEVDVILDTLASLNSVQVALFDDGSDMKQWIDQVQDFLPKSYSLTVLDRVDDLRRIVPGLDNTTLAWLKTRQARHSSTGATPQDSAATSQSPNISSEVGTQHGYQPTEVQRSSRALGDPDSTIRTIVLPIDDDFAKGELENLEYKGQVVPFAEEPIKSSEIWEPKQGPLTSKGHKIVDNQYVDEERDLRADLMSHIVRLVHRQARELTKEDGSSFGNIDTKLSGSTKQEFSGRLGEHQQIDNLNIQEHSLRVQLEALQKQERLLGMQQEALHTQGRLLQMQQETLDRLALISRKASAILSQTYELHEYLIPRLFIVLPELDFTVQGKTSHLFAQRFRLYFLCECGEHTRPTDGRPRSLPHDIHLARHEGYDLDRPTEFFEKYGSYVLTLLQILKYGAAVAGVVIPPLAQLRIADGLDTAKQSADVLYSSMEPKVDSAIEYLQSLSSSNQGSSTTTENTSTYGDSLEALEGVDLRQLSSFLKIRDEGQVLGNLYRTVTGEGHVKWVCLDHYRERYREAAVQTFKKTVEDIGGTYDEQTGRVAVRLDSPGHARQFYIALSSTRPVYVLELTLDWNMSMEDSKILQRVIQPSNIFHLSLDLSYKTGSLLDVVYRNRRAEAIVHIMSSSKIHTMSLRNSVGFLSQAKDLLKTRSLPVRDFDLGELVSTADDFLKLGNLIRACPALVRLAIVVEDIDSAIDQLRVPVRLHKTLSNLEIRLKDGATASVQFEKGSDKISRVNLKAVERVS